MPSRSGSIAILAMLSALIISPVLRADEPIRIIAFGAHPDDCEYDLGGTAALWAQLGFQVKFVALTNGDIGHHEIGGAPLARRRTAEVKRCAKILGISATEVMDIHDGELIPSLENRRTITRKIREWQADIVIAPRPNDYHPDHRYTGVLIQDAAFMVIVPGFCPDVPALRKNPVFLYTEDEFRRPNSFEPSVVVPIDSIVRKKLDAFDALESQFYEWDPWIADDVDQVPKDKSARRKWLDEESQKIFARTANRFRSMLTKQLGERRGKGVKYAEAFEVCEYGTQPSPEYLKRIFPFLSN